MQFPKLYSTAEAARILGIQPCTLEAWRARRGGLRYYRIGRTVRYSERDLGAFLKEGACGPDPTSQHNTNESAEELPPTISTGEQGR